MNTGYVLKLLVAAVVVVLSFGAAHADGGCKDDDNWDSQCKNIPKNVCGSATGPCVVKVSQATNVTVTHGVKNDDASVICVSPKQEVQFVEATTNGSFLLHFGEKQPKTSPFPTLVLFGDEINTLKQTAGNTGCYAYRVYHHVPGDGWKTLDPKIIVGTSKAHAHHDGDDDDRFSSIESPTDPVTSDPKHYSVMSENEQVRILKVHYGANEKSIMHSHPDAVAVFLNDAKMRFTYPDHKFEDRSVKAGDAQFTPHTVHLPENTGKSAMDVIVIELKGKMAKPTPKNHMEKMKKK